MGECRLNGNTIPEDFEGEKDPRVSFSAARVGGMRAFRCIPHRGSNDIRTRVGGKRHPYVKPA